MTKLKAAAILSVLGIFFSLQGASACTGGDGGDPQASFKSFTQPYNREPAKEGGDGTDPRNPGKGGDGTDPRNH